MTTHSNYSLQTFSTNNAKVLTENSQPVFDFTVIRQSSGSRQAVVKQSSGNCHAVITQSSHSRQAVVRQSSGRHQIVIMCKICLSIAQPMGLKDFSVLWSQLWGTSQLWSC